MHHPWVPLGCDFSQVRMDNGRRVDLEIDPLNLVPGDIIFLQATAGGTCGMLDELLHTHMFYVRAVRALLNDITKWAPTSNEWS